MHVPYALNRCDCDADATAFGYKPGQLPQQPQIYPADQALLAELTKAATKAKLATKEGLIVTGDQFVASKEKIQAIKEIYQIGRAHV